MIKGGRIIFRFYEKPTASRKCLIKTAAMPWEQKKASLSQDTVRRMINTSEETGQCCRDKILEVWIGKLRHSGYNESEIKEIISSGLVRYERLRGKL